MRDIEALNKLLLDNSLLEELEEKINMKPNIFSILRLTDVEIRHSNFLAWLLNPRENHGLGGSFLEAVIKWYVKEYVEANEAIKLLLANYSNFRIERETDSIDLSLISDKDKIVFAIENKIHSGVNGNQLVTYPEKIKKRYRGYTNYFIFLTLDGSEPPEMQETWLPMSYSVIIEILENLLEKNTLNNEVELIIKNYIEAIRSVIEVENPEIKELCMKIYERHKQAIDLIIDNVPLEKQQLAEDLHNWIMEEWSKKINFKNPKNHKWFEFWTDNMDQMMPRKNGNMPYEYYIVVDQFYCKIALVLLSDGITDTDNYELVKKMDLKIKKRSPEKVKGQNGKKWGSYIFQSWTVDYSKVDDFSYEDYSDKMKSDIEEILFKKIPELEAQIKEIKEDM